MPNIQFKNFARSTLAIGAAAGATSLTLATGTGSRFPAITAPQYFYLTLENASLTREIVMVTARSGDTLTVVRAQDGTTAQSWNAGDVASCRLNAQALVDIFTSAVLADAPTGAAQLPKGSTAQRPAGTDKGRMRYNETIDTFEGYGSAGWGAIGGGGTVADGVLLETGETISNDYTLTAGKNALAVRKLSVASGKKLTIPTGKAVVVVGAGGRTAETDRYVNTTSAQTISGAKNFTAAPTLNGADMTPIGVNQTWQTVTRNAGTTYYNTTGRPITHNARTQGPVNVATVTMISINGGAAITITSSNQSAANAGDSCGSIVIPAGASYVFTDTNVSARFSWELR